MARRKKTSPFDDLIFIASRLPWWLSLLIAFVAWVIFHSYATSQQPTLTDPKQFGQLAAGTIFQVISMLLQYLVPLAFVFGAIGSVLGRLKRRRLMEDVASATKPGKTLEGISWQQFEQLVGEAFRRQGFTVTETGGNGPDGGIDLILHKDREKYLVQCKQWRSLKVGVAVVRELFGVIAAEGAVGGFLVTSGTFTSEAKAFASGKNIRLIDNAELGRWVAHFYRSNFVQEPIATTHVANKFESPICPVCHSAMRKKIARRGSNAGNQFWSCLQYPRCRGSLSCK